MLRHRFSRSIMQVWTRGCATWRQASSPLAALLLTVPALTPAWAEQSLNRDQRRQELRQALQAQRQVEPTDAHGDSTMRSGDAGRRLTPEELLALRRQLQEMRGQRHVSPELPDKGRP